MITQSSPRYWSDHVDSFDAIYSGEGRTTIGRWLDLWLRHDIYDRLAETTRRVSELGQRQSVLDVGTGTGRLCLPLAQAGHHVVGLDFAPAMLDRARAITAKAGVAERCEFVEGDLLTGVTPGLAGRRFDAVAVLGVLDYISDPLPLLRTSLSFRPKRIIASFPRADTLRSGLRRLRYRIQGLDCPLFFYTRAQVSRLADELGAPRSRVDLMGQLHLACFDFKR